MAEEKDGETTFSPTNSSKDHLNAEQTLQNKFLLLAEDIRHPGSSPLSSKGVLHGWRNLEATGRIRLKSRGSRLKPQT